MQYIARIEVQLGKNKQSEMEEKIYAGDIIIDEISHTVTADGKTVLLTKTEYTILMLLARNSGQVIAKSVILDKTT